LELSLCCVSTSGKTLALDASEEHELVVRFSKLVQISRDGYFIPNEKGKQTKRISFEFEEWRLGEL